MAIPVIGGTTTIEQVNLEVVTNDDLDFDVEWWAIDEITPIMISAVEAKIVNRASDAIILDFAQYCTIAGNVIQVRIPAVATVNLAAIRGALWYIRATKTVDGDKKTLTRGDCEVIRHA